MKRIWKYELRITDGQFVVLPKDAELLCVQVQRDKPCLWAIGEEHGMREERLIIIHGTGHQVSSNLGRYLGTFQIQNGDLVYHVFEGGK